MKGVEGESPRPAGPSATTATHAVLTAAGIGLMALYLLTFCVANVSLQWDFRTYVLAAKAAVSGLSPYRVADLSMVAGRPVLLPFVYPPVGLIPFLPFVDLSKGTAGAAWMIGKVVILGLLVFAWARWWTPRAGALAVALLAVFGWNASALADLRTGNVAILECGLLWLAFACYVRGRRTLFGALVIVASIFKVVPGAYLLLLLVPSRSSPPQVVRLGTSVAVLAAIVGVPLLVGPAASWGGFTHLVAAQLGLGAANPSSLALVHDLIGRMVGDASWRVPLAWCLWGVYGAALGVVSLPLFRYAWRMKDPTLWVMIAVFVELLVSPRPMSYGFLRLGPAPLYFAPVLLKRRYGSLMLAAMLSIQGLALSAHHQLIGIGAFAPFLLTLGIWLGVRYSIASGTRSAGDETPQLKAA